VKKQATSFVFLAHSSTMKIVNFYQATRRNIPQTELFTDFFIY
jgi:hypothetical protein